jgi:hypothetical protein
MLTFKYLYDGVSIKFCKVTTTIFGQTFLNILGDLYSVTTLPLEESEDDTHTPEMGTWESTRTPKILEFDYRGQNTSH